MKLQYLGTGAAEGIPGVFCDCDVCREAKRRGGRNIRTRSQALLDDRLLIDFPSETYAHYLKNDYDLPAIHACIITHSHEDHLYPVEIFARKEGFSYRKTEEPLVFYSGKSGYDMLCGCINKYGVKDYQVQAKWVKPFESFETEGYTVTALNASHDPKTNPYVYIVEKDGKRLLYAHDTSDFPKETWEYLEKYGKVFNLVSLDCTEGDKPINYVGHMNLERCMAMRDRLCELSLADKNTKFVLNHFSHNGGNVLYEEFCSVAQKVNFIVAYDGLTVEV